MDDSLSPAAAPGRCSRESHDAIRADVARFAALSALKAPHNTMPTYADAGEPDTLLLADCPLCKSTLCREVYAADLQRDLASWSWRDRTEDMAALGFPARTTRYVEVYADGRCTVACIDDTGISHWSDVEIDWLDVVLADVNGKRVHEEAGCDGEQSAFARVA